MLGHTHHLLLFGELYGIWFLLISPSGVATAADSHLHALDIVESAHTV